jgi:hypothetical protein
MHGHMNVKVEMNVQASVATICAVALAVTMLLAGQSSSCIEERVD